MFNMLYIDYSHHLLYRSNLLLMLMLQAVASWPRHTVFSSLSLGLVSQLIRATDYPCLAYLRAHQKRTGHPKPTFALLSKCWLGRIISIGTFLKVRRLTSDCRRMFIAIVVGFIATERDEGLWTPWPSKSLPRWMHFINTAQGWGMNGGHLAPESGMGCLNSTYGSDGQMSTNFWLYGVCNTFVCEPPRIRLSGVFQEGTCRYNFTQPALT